MNEYAVLILTHGRPDQVKTIHTLEHHGYTGPWYLVVDDEDPTVPEYQNRYGTDRVIVFSKDEVAETFDEGDNFTDRRCIVYARNAAFDIAKALGFRYFIQLDDDYDVFTYRFNDLFQYQPRIVRNLDSVFVALVDFYAAAPSLTSIAMAQGGDFMGGAHGVNPLVQHVRTRRKAMNSFICDTERPFTFPGRLNEDVNAYTGLQRKGSVFLTINQVSLDQEQTQSSGGGMTDIYLAAGTYVKSFYSVMHAPSGVHVSNFGRVTQRIHHLVDYDAVAPKILAESYRKVD